MIPTPEIRVTLRVEGTMELRELLAAVPQVAELVRTARALDDVLTGVHWDSAGVPDEFSSAIQNMQRALEEFP